MKKRISVLVLCMIMVVSLLPYGVMAEEVTEPTEETIEVTTDVSEGELLVQEENENVGYYEEEFESDCNLLNEEPSAESAEINYHNQFYYKLIDNELHITRACDDVHYKENGDLDYTDRCMITSLEIPETLPVDGTDYPVTHIDGSVWDGTGAFKDCFNLAAVGLPSSLKSIGDKAFEGCNSLTYVLLPEGLEYLGSNAFGGCLRLTGINIPKNCHTHEYAGEQAYPGPFANTPALTSVAIEDGRTRIDNGFFEYSGITEITIPASVTEIDKYAFYDTKNLDTVIFAENSKLQSIGWKAFCGSGISSFYMPETVSFADVGAFAGCDQLRTVLLSANLTCNVYQTERGYDTGIFSGCTGLTNIIFPEGLETIGRCWFFDSPITTVTIPASVTKIDDDAFRYCLNLSEVQFEEGCSLTEIGNTAFRKDESLKQFNFPKTVKTIGGNAFESTGLTEVVLPDSLETMYNGAFNNCPNLTSVTIPAGMTYEWGSDNGAFEGSNALKTVTFKPGVTKIDAGLFGWNEGIESIEIPEGVTSIGARAFRRDYNLKTVTLPASLTEIGYGAFSDCTALKTINFSGKRPQVTSSICESVTATVYFGKWDEEPDNWGGDLTFVGEIIDPAKENLQLLYDHFSLYSKKEMTDDSWAAFQAALEDAGEVLNNDKATKEAFEKATVALETALDSLVPAFWAFKNRNTYTTDLMLQDRIVLADLDPVTYASKLVLEIEGMMNGTNAIGASCYGMSLSYAQAKRGILAPGSIEKGCSVLGQISRTSDRARSYIARCHLYQFTHQFIKLNARYLSEYPTDSRKLNHLLTEADEYYDQHPVLFGIGGAGGGGHAMAIYGYENGTWDITNPNNNVTYTYNCRFKVYDCNYPTARTLWEDDLQAPVDLTTGYPEAAVLAEAADFAYDRYLYYNTNADFWAYPAEGRFHMDSGGQDINIFIPDIAELTNKISPSVKSLYITGREKVKYGLYQAGEKIGELAGQLKSDVYQFLPTFDGDDENSNLLGTYIINQDCIIEGEPITIKTEDGADFGDYFQISYGGFIIAGHAQGACELTIYPDGRATLNGVSGKCDLTVSKDGEMITDGVHALTISGDNLSSESLSLETTDEGLLVTGDSLNALTASGINVSETDIKEAALVVDGDYSSVILSGTDGANPLLTVLADDDGDHIYDKKITSGYLKAEQNIPFQSCITGITLDKTMATMATSHTGKNDSTLQLKAAIAPADATQDKGITWTSSDPTIAKVDSTGKVTALRYGKVTITATSKANSKIKATCEIQTRYYDVMGSPVRGEDGYKYWFAPVYWAADKAITKGYNNVYFAPEENCTREQMITFLWRLKGSPKPKTTNNPFKDVVKGKYYYNAVLWGYENGITKGYSSGPNKGKFGVGFNVTREDTVTFIYRLAGTPKVASADLGKYTFKDIKKNAYYQKPVAWAAKKGITNGYSSGKNAGKFGVGFDVLRKDIVTFLYRYAK